MRRQRPGNTRGWRSPRTSRRKPPGPRCAGYTSDRKRHGRVTFWVGVSRGSGPAASERVVEGKRTCRSPARGEGPDERDSRLRKERGLGRFPRVRRAARARRRRSTFIHWFRARAPKRGDKCGQSRLRRGSYSEPGISARQRAHSRFRGFVFDGLHESPSVRGGHTNGGGHSRRETRSSQQGRPRRRATPREESPGRCAGLGVGGPS